MMAANETCDLAIVGGGLAGGLLALMLAERRPEWRVLLLEHEAQLGGNHVWSFFDSDIDARDREMLGLLVTHRWATGHEVRFPSHGRRLSAPYNSITSARFDAHLRAVLGERVRTGVEVEAIGPDHVVLADGRMVSARAVIDARGFAGPDDPLLAAIEAGWQKFVGQTLRLKAPHGINRPVIMDARVEQIDGYRFVYLLPVSDHEIFVEDTYYSDDPVLDVGGISHRIADYATAQGWAVEAVVHQETGVLPVVIGGNFAAFWPADDPVARAGVRAGLFHPTTGYSLADAVRFARHVASLDWADGADLARQTRAFAARHWRQGAYYRMLDTMLFRAAAPAERYRIFQRFYRLNERLVGRFYAGQSNMADKIRILCGRPPVPIRAAMHALMNRTG